MTCHLVEKKEFGSADELTLVRSELWLDRSHFMVFSTRCTECGQLYAVCFVEFIDWGGGNDDQWVFYVPIDAVQEAELRSEPYSVVDLIQTTRHITWHPNDKVYWTTLREMALAMGP
jgi:hypothetical protein